ncbi:hypothetical protein FB451DRAFT_1073796 [Mycena latifolia]|nr:hypothetical protein FB451DRAFT_1073796 [Mycena latifolia]
MPSELGDHERPYGLSAARERMFKQYMEMEGPNKKQAWTFPSPFIAYAANVSGSRGEICWGPEPRTLAELRMYRLSWAIRSKPDWQRKMCDPIIMDKWRKEALKQQEHLPVEDKLTTNMINYVLSELAAYVRLADPNSGIEVERIALIKHIHLSRTLQSGPFDAIWYSDRLVSNETSNLLRAAAAELENVPADLKDWHPGSNGQVLDLVHPSLYPIIYGRTRSSENSGSTLLVPPVYKNSPNWDSFDNDDSEHYADRAVSNNFCWLPSDFTVNAADGSVKLVSPYINNLHPTTHKPIYRLIEAVLSAFVPLFDRVLSQINGEDRDLYRDITPGSGRIMAERTRGTWAGYNNKFGGIAVPCIWSKGEPRYELDMSDEAYTKLLEEAPKVLPEAYKEDTGELEKTIVPYSLRGKTIQCIIKLANIHLTPENPDYKGGSWHVEGMLNEHIVASGIYYYEEDNISESRLAFRVNTGPPVYHQQDDELCMKILYGMKRDSYCCQDLGSIATSAGRALAWPNIYQHCVAPFQLVDPTKPGHRKILAIFLVDPSIEPIPSATNVLPQQADWAFAALEEARGDPSSAFSRLPPELSNAIRDRFPETLVTREEAEAYRLDLMKERTAFDEAHDEELSYSFNMCEH